jgi:dCMP deaminase
MSDLDFLRLAAQHARYSSEDARTQNAAILHCGDYTIAAANRYPIRRWASGEYLNPPLKYEYIEHAERGAIYEAARSGRATDGATLYAVWFSCPDCSRAIIGAGIKTVVGSLHAREATPERWTVAVARGESMLRDAGVNMRWLADRVGVSIRFDGKELRL